jgi:hypothetical protein
VTLNLAPPFKKKLAFVFVPAISRNCHCFVLDPLINTVLLFGASVLTTWWVIFDIFALGTVTFYCIYAPSSRENMIIIIIIML